LFNWSWGYKYGVPILALIGCCAELEKIQIARGP
jgi:hypothetical protein